MAHVKEKRLPSRNFAERLGSMLRVDARRMFGTPLFLICLGIAFVIPVLVLVMTSAFGGEENAMFTNTWQIIGSESADLSAMMAGMAGAMGGGDAAAAAGAGMMDMTAMMNINLMYFMMAVFVCLFTAEDFRSGYAKNLFTVRARKTDYVASKTIIGFIAGTLFLITFFIGGVVGGSVAGLPFELGAAGVSGLVMCMLADLPYSSLRGNLPAHECHSKEPELDEHMSVPVRRDAAVHDGSNDDAAGFRLHECRPVPGRRGYLRCRYRHCQQHSFREDKSGWIKKNPKKP